MPVNQFLSLLASGLGALGSIYVLKSLVRLSHKEIAHITSAKWDFNDDAIRSLSEQKGDAEAGTAVIVLAFLSAAGATLTPPGLPLSAALWHGGGLALLITLAVAACALSYSRRRGKAIYNGSRDVALEQAGYNPDETPIVPAGADPAP